MEFELYRTVLILGGVVNLLIALALLHNNVDFRIYDVYHRSRSLVAHRLPASCMAWLAYNVARGCLGTYG